jgi:myo-inositol 2-dehydrogenase/D-chiro-inositol 1-dehydrogenase
MTKIERRTFLKQAAAISAFTILSPRIVFGTQANSAIRVGIIGCGSRGTAVLSSMSQHTNTAVVAMADLFDDQLKRANPVFNELNTAKKMPIINKANIYQGSKAYLRLIENKDVDAVLISSPAYTHAEFLEAAVAAGKHVYCEKPVATDVAGCNRIVKAGEKLNGKQSVVIGFQIRHASPYVGMVKQIQSGAIGDIVNAQLYYLSSATKLHELNNVSDDEFRIRNHYLFRALCGDIILDQAIHMIDVCNWALQGHPLQAIGSGGNEHGYTVGDVWNNFQVIYQYPKNINVSVHATKVGPAFGDVCCRFLGTKGSAEAHYSGGVFIKGENMWDSGIAKGDSKLTPEQQAAGIFDSSLHDADANKEKAFIGSIVSGKYLNETRSGADSTLAAILGRESALQKKEMKWDELVASNQRLDPKLNLSQFDKVKSESEK